MVWLVLHGRASGFIGGKGNDHWASRDKKAGGPYVKGSKPAAVGPVLLRLRFIFGACFYGPKEETTQ